MIINKAKFDFDLTKIENVVFEDVDFKDYPDFCNAYIASANYDGREMTEDELEDLNNADIYRLWKYQQLENFIY